MEIKALGPVPVKGMPEPVEIFELVRTEQVHWRLEASAARGLTPFVGREDEVDALHQAMGAVRPARATARWWRCRASRGWASRACSGSSPALIARTAGS